MDARDVIDTLDLALECGKETANVIRSAAIESLRGQRARAAVLSARASVARSALPPGSSRAKVTTLNAKWARHAEEVTRLDRALAALAATTVAS